MKEKAKKIQLKREAYRKGLPQIKLETCRLEEAKDTELQRYIIEGNPVVLGAVLPKVEIGGLPPQKLMASANRKVVVGLVRGAVKNKNVIIDYGFTKDSCTISEAGFSTNDAKRYKEITKSLIRKARKRNLWEKIIRFFHSLITSNKN